MRKIISFLTVLILLFMPVFSNADQLPEKEYGTTSYTYSFAPGSIINSQGKNDISELINTLQFRLIRQLGETEDIYKISLLSKGKEVFYITAQDSSDGHYGMICSLMGDHVFQCEKTQITDFMLTFVKVLSDLKILHGESLSKFEAIAKKTGAVLENLSTQKDIISDEGIVSISQYTDRIKKIATAINEKVLDKSNENYPESVYETEVILSEADMNRLIDTALTKLCSIPVISDELKKGSIIIGNQRITDEFIRNTFTNVHGTTKLTIFSGEDRKVNKIYLLWPDLSSLQMIDENFTNLKGLQINISRMVNNNEIVSDTYVSFIGGDSLMNIRLQKQPADPINTLPQKTVHYVGTMDSASLWKTIKDMGMIIIGNALNLVLELPSCIFNALAGSFFK